MASPLSPLPSSAFNNLSTPPANRHTTSTTSTSNGNSNRNRNAANNGNGNGNNNQGHNAFRTSSNSSSDRPDNIEKENDADGDIYEGDGDSSPFMSHIKDDDSSPQVTSSPFKARPMSRIYSGSELSPLKILQQQHQQHQQTQQQPQHQQSPQPQQNDRQQSPPSSDGILSPTRNMAPPPLPQSPRKMSNGIKRFPVKISPLVPNETPAAQHQTQERQISLQDAIRENEGLKHAIDIFDDEVSVLDGVRDGDNDHHGSNGDNDRHDDSDDTLLTASAEQELHDKEHGYDDSHAGADDTMISTFSAFSSVPNMTMLAQMRDSPGKFSVAALAGGTTPRAPRPDHLPPMVTRTPRGGSAAADQQQYSDSAGGNTMNLMDFTEQMRYGGIGGYPPQQSPPRRHRQLSPARTGAPPTLATVGATPQRNRNSLVNLLDFDIPPMPTPRSIPTITPRELESLKSSFLSEISSLKASLSGKEAEVMSLKTAVGDAEKRVGECMEELREVRGTHENLVAERDSWEKRGREMEAVLRKVKGEIVLGQREREELEFKLDEAEKRREAAEMMAQDAESKMAGMRAGKASAEAAAANGDSSDRIRSPTTAGASNKEVEMAVERVARDLHSLYKSKHESKVAALKKSYENRWEKRVRELQTQVDDLIRENDELRVGRDITMTKVELARVTELEEERKVEKAKDNVHIRGLEAEVDKLEAVLRTVKDDNAELRVLLERERVEKGELVMLAEEMMNMQSRTPARPAVGGGPRGTPMTGRTQHGATSSISGETTTNFRGSIAGGRTSNLRAPGTSLFGKPAESRIGRMGGPGQQHERTKSGATTTSNGSSSSGMGRPGSGLGSRTGLMSSIEKMGSYRGGGRQD
ncbi:hypothetical protein B0T17DRAFT_587018 [Bombardia bombarda]|uniref:Uncharacterized protein n=1 Tax=Bombardia bombarda TaxID=252184 RepID=A0AA40CE80_9PEZI|nr:hypothetical protein B0T17DRAFT_587018 [Bombardia bombarda]